MAKPRVLSIHGSLSKDIKREKVAKKVDKREKSFKIKSPKNIPPNKERRIFLE